MLVVQYRAPTESSLILFFFYGRGKLIHLLKFGSHEKYDDLGVNMKNTYIGVSLYRFLELFQCLTLLEAWTNGQMLILQIVAKA